VFGALVCSAVVVMPRNEASVRDSSFVGMVNSKKRKNVSYYFYLQACSNIFME
jgi:hypothetical protein